MPLTIPKWNNRPTSVGMMARMETGRPFHLSRGVAMRAVTLNEVPAVPAMTEVAAPRPAAGEVLVKGAVSSATGFDLSGVSGRLDGMREHRFPLVVGMDFAGTVEAIGAGVEGFAAGDAVFGVALKP